MVQRKQSIAPLALGKEVTVLNSTPTAAGTEELDFVIQADTVLVSLQASVVSGTLDIEVFTEGTQGIRTSVIKFPSLSAPTAELLLRKAAATMQKVIVKATYTGTCSFIVRARGTSTGVASVTIEGSSNWEVSRTSVTSTAAVLIPAALTDRRGILVENVSDISGTAGIIYVSETLAKATTGLGHPVRSGGNYAIDLAAGGEVYAVSDGGTVAVSVIEAGGD